MGPMELVRSEPFTVSRVEVARAAAEAYVRSFWWFVIPGPLFGLAMVALSQDERIQALGMLGVMWPLSIPARAYFISGGLAKRLSKPTTVAATEVGLFFAGERAQFKALYTSLRHVSIRHGMFVIRSRRFEAILVPVAAFPNEEGRQRFLQALHDHGVPMSSNAFMDL